MPIAQACDQIIKQDHGIVNPFTQATASSKELHKDSKVIKKLVKWLFDFSFGVIYCIMFGNIIF